MTITRRQCATSLVSGAVTMTAATAMASVEPTPSDPHAELRRLLDEAMERDLWADRLYGDEAADLIYYAEVQPLRHALCQTVPMTPAGAIEQLRYCLYEKEIYNDLTDDGWDALHAATKFLETQI